MENSWLEKDFYAVLGVDRKASKSDIKKKYRALAQELHPDRTEGNAGLEERFKEVSEAYSVLSDESKRKEYDEARSLLGSGHRSSQGFGGYTRSGGPDISDIFGGHEGVGDLFGNLFGGGGYRSAPREPRRGSDVESEIEIGFDEALDGVTIPLKLREETVCDACGGAGQRQTQAGITVCESCNGYGTRSTSRSINTRIPAGVRDGTRIRLAGKGTPGEPGALAGDLYLNIRVTKHAVYGRDGDNITVKVPISFPEAVNGGDITIPTPRDGNVTVRIPAGTQNGRVFRVKNKGVKSKKGRGDMLVTVEIAIPSDLSPAARKALADYAAETKGHNPREALYHSSGGGAS